MIKTCLLSLSFICLVIITKAQDFEYGTATSDEIAMQKYAKDTSAHAVVLNEYGKSRIDMTNSDKLELIYNYHVKIKVFDNAGFDNGNVEIPLYNNSSGDDFEEINDIKGVTTYVDDNGAIQKVELDPKKVYRVKENKYYTNIKFAMPALSKGCIVEYSYTIFSPFWERFHPWIFQWDIPKVYSEYDIHIPAFWTYNASIRGALKITKNVAELERECFSAGGSKCDCSHFIYGMSDIPAFVEEADMTSRNNFISAIYFELTEFINPFDGTKNEVAKEWKDVDYSLKHDDDFGGQIKKKDIFKEKLAPVIAGKTDSLEKAKAVYAYIKESIKWNEFTSIESEDGIRKAVDNHTGNSGDINLALVAALNSAGLNAEAVLLSTREHGAINRLYPVITEFDYVIAMVNIGGQSYLLDATEPLLPFGMLPMRCLNDQGRVMSLNKPSYWIDLNTDQKEINTYTLDLTLQTDGKIKGTMIHYSTGYAAYEKRKEIKKFNSVDEYVESLDEKSSKLKILNSAISGVDTLDEPLTEKYEIEIKEYSNMDHDRLSFNPVLFGRTESNPFKLADRTYPVDWGMPSVKRFALTMHLPDGYTIESSPPNIGVTLPNAGGRFLTDLQTSNNSFTFSYIMGLNKPVYSREEYPYLKELFNKIILSEKAQMIFKKKI